MTISKRDIDLLRDRLSKLESLVRALEDKIKIQENRIKGDNLLRAIREAEEHEKHRKEREIL